MHQKTVGAVGMQFDGRTSCAGFARTTEPEAGERISLLPLVPQLHPKQGQLQEVSSLSPVPFPAARVTTHSTSKRCGCKLNLVACASQACSAGAQRGPHSSTWTIDRRLGQPAGPQAMESHEAKGSRQRVTQAIKDDDAEELERLIAAGADVSFCNRVGLRGDRGLRKLRSHRSKAIRPRTSPPPGTSSRSCPSCTARAQSSTSAGWVL
jgi:hypothetical protein